LFRADQSALNYKAWNHLSHYAEELGTGLKIRERGRTKTNKNKSLPTTKIL